MTNARDQDGGTDGHLQALENEIAGGGDKVPPLPTSLASFFAAKSVAKRLHRKASGACVCVCVTHAHVILAMMKLASATRRGPRPAVVGLANPILLGARRGP